MLKCHQVCQRKFCGVGASRQVGAPSKSGWNLSTIISDLALFPHCCGLSSAALAANAIVDTVRSLTNDTPGNDWHSVAVCSDGSYDVEKGLISSFPIRVRGGKWEIVQGLPINDFSRAKIDASVAELREEKSLVSELIS